MAFIKWVDIYVSSDNACTWTLQDSEGNLMEMCKGHGEQKSSPKK